MQSVSFTDFKAHCLGFLNKVAKTGEPLILTKHGKPAAMVSPSPVDSKKRWVLGQFKDSTKIVGDLLKPFDEPWEANS